MAGLKKKKKEKSGNPNTVLIVFLVLFVLVSIGLGAWVYSLYGVQEDFRTKTRTSEATAKAEKISAVYYKLLWRDLRTAISNQKLEADEQQELDLDRESLSKGTFASEKYADVAKKLMDENRAALGAQDGKNYDKSYSDMLRLANGKIDELNGKLTAALAKNTRVEAEIAKQNQKQDTFHQDAVALIQKGNADAVKEARIRSEAFIKLTEDLGERNAKIADYEQKIGVINEDHEKQMKKLNRTIKDMVAAADENARDGARGTINNAPRGDSSPLVLDVSTGKPLWDSPVAKIIRVEPDLRTVTINVGSAQGARPELSFNIFGVNSSGRATGQLKGSVEVVKVVDPSNSIARITSLYDADGKEIALNDASRNRIVRETESPIKEGDLLFNMFWGTRVAITGYVSITGEPSDNPAEQIRQMEDFMYLLQRNGMTIDSYVDLRDGTTRGKVTGKTRYLIRGDDFRTEAAPKAAAPAAGDDKDKDKEEDKKPAAKEAPNADRAEAINKANAALRRDAMDKGVLLISPENFANVIGYRKARNGNEAQTSDFRPSLPYAGTNIGGAPAAPAPAKQPDPEK